MLLVTFCIYLSSFLISAFDLSDQCLGPEVSLRINPDADVKFTVILSLREPTADNKCGSEWSGVAAQSVAVIQWAVERINNASFIQGIKLGFDVYDDCGLNRYSISKASDVVDGFPLGSEACANEPDSVCQIGIIGTSKSETTAAVLETISGTNIPVLSPFATYPDLSRSWNFYRTTLSEDQQLEAIVAYLQTVNWHYIAVVHTDDQFGKYGSVAIKTMGKKKGICVDVTYEISTLEDIAELFTELQHQKALTKDNSLGVVFLGGKDMATYLLRQLNFEADVMNNIYWLMTDLVGNDLRVFEALDDKVANKTVVFSKFTTPLPSVNAYIKRKWESAINSSSSFQDDFDSLLKCTDRTVVPEWTNEYAESTIDAVYVLASALQRQQRYYCPTQQGVCQNLRQNFKLDSDLITNPLIYDELPTDTSVPEFAAVKKEVRFTKVGELVLSSSLPISDIYMYTRNKDTYNLTKIAVFRNASIVKMNITNEASTLDIMPSICGESCPNCVDTTGLRYLYIDGDSLILGLFSFHETNPDDPFRCGEVRFFSNDIIVLEAFLHRVDQLTIDTGIKFGAVVFDDCYSSAHTELIITQFLSGDLVLKKPNSSESIDTSKILAAVGSLGSDVTIPLSFLFTKLKIPFISSTSSSPDLDDRVNFPYFLRTVPSDVEQARAMVEIMKYMGWEYVSALYVGNNYGSKGKEQFLNFANKSNICVAESPEAIPEVDADRIDLQGTFSRLKNQNSKVVMYFGTESRIVDFLRVVDNRNDFIFLASEDWGNQEYILQIGRLGTLGSVILKNEGVSLTKDDSFIDYAKRLDPYNNVRNPWFTEYWELLFNCDLPLSFNDKYNTTCDSGKSFNDEFLEGFLTNQRVIHIIDAVDGLGQGLKRSKMELCEFDNSFPCPNYFKYILNVVRNIKEVSLQRGSKNIRLFKDDGNGNVGFEILNVQQDQNQELIYVQVGTYNDHGLQLSRSSMKLREPNFDAVCTQSLCGHCTNTSERGNSIQDVVTHTHPTEANFAAPHFTIIGLLAFLIVFLVIMMIAVVCFFKRRVTDLERQLIKTCNDLKHQGTATSRHDIPYVNQNGSAVPNINSDNATNHRSMNFVKLGPSGETLQDWRDAQLLLNANTDSRVGLNGGNGGRNGHINKAFVGDDPGVNSPGQSPQRGNKTQNVQDSPYNPPKSSYGLSTHNSFKRIDASGQSTSPLKKQPRTQLAVPPCRPDLPPRNEHAQRPEHLNLALAAAVPKEKPRKHRSPPRKSSLSPRELRYTPSLDSVPRNNSENMESPGRKAHIPYMAFSSGTLQNEDSQTSPSGRINVHGSMEKISRV